MKSKVIFSLFATAILLLLIAQPIMADEVTDAYEGEGSFVLYEIPYGDGLDNDGDGTIDELDEINTVNGSKEYNDSDYVTDTWFKNFTFPYYVENGVYMTARYDRVGEFYSNENISISPTQSCYYTSTAFGAYENYSTYISVNNVLNVISFYVNLSPKVIMNGAQEFWYRSPLVWNDDDNDYTAHYLNIYDGDGNLVWASPDEDYNDPQPKYVVDSSEQNGTGGERVYYRINMNFRSDEKYCFKEYVSIDGDDPINSVKFYAAPYQDIGLDEETDTYIFHGTTYARKIPIECSWSAVFTVGIGRSGTENIVYSSTDYDLINRPTIYTDIIHMAGLDDVGSVTIIFPLRTTTPLNISISYRVWSGEDYQAWVSPDNVSVATIDNITGTLIATFNIIDPNIAEDNYYQFGFTILNFNVSNEAMTYTMYPNIGSTHMIGYGLENYTISHFSVHIEIAESADTLVEDTETSMRWDLLLIGILMMVVGIILTATVIGATVGLPLTVAGIAIGSAFFAYGFHLTYAGLTGDTTFVDALHAGTARVYNWALNGIEWLGGELLKALVWVYETLLWLGDVLMQYGAIIMAAIYQVIWLIAFLVVIWIWSRFLNIMKYVTLGEPEKALKTISQTASDVTQSKKVKRGIKTAIKLRTGIGNIRKERRERKQRWYNKEMKKGEDTGDEKYRFS